MAVAAAEAAAAAGEGGREGVVDGCVMGLSLALVAAGCVLVRTLKYLTCQLKIHGNICVTNTAAKKSTQSQSTLKC